MELVDKIDTFLKWLYIHSGENPTFSSLYEGVKNEGVHEGELDDCLKKLHKDGFLYFMYRDGNVVNNYWRDHNFLITFDGKYFWETVKGYKEKIRIENAKIQAISDQNQRMEKNEELLVSWTKNLADRTKSLTNWTRAVAVGAIGLVVWEIIAFLLEHSCFSAH